MTSCNAAGCARRVASGSDAWCGLHTRRAQRIYDDHPKAPRYWHGGAPGLRRGDLIAPRPAGDTQHLHDGCPTCEARRTGDPLPTDDNNPSFVYVTTDREYARIYAAGYPRGALYCVEPVGPLIDRSENDPAPSWGCSAARVLSVYDPIVILSPKRIRQLARRIGVAS